MKRMRALIVVAAFALPLCGRCSHEDHENRRQRVFDRWDRASGHGPVTPSATFASTAEAAVAAARAPDG